MPLERRDELARASAARAQRNRGVGLLLISLGVAFWLGVFLVYFVLWLAGVDLGNWPLLDRVHGVRSVALAGHARPPHACQRRRERARRGRSRADRLPPAVRRRPGGDCEAAVVARAHLAPRGLREDLRGAAGAHAAHDRAVRGRRRSDRAAAAAWRRAHVCGRRGVAGDRRRADRSCGRRHPARRRGGRPRLGGPVT